MSARVFDSWRLALRKPPYDPGIEAGTGADKRVIAGFYGSREEAERNARLCVAAPALRDALTEAIDVIKSWHGPIAWDIYFDHSPEMKRIRAALAASESA